MSLIQVLLCAFLCNLIFSPGFSWSFDNITVSNKKNASNKKPINVFEITLQYFHKNIIIPLLCQFELLMHTCVSKISIVPKDMIFYLLRYN